MSYTLYDVEVESPGTLRDALRLLGGGGYKVIAGGTDVLVQLRDGILSERRLLNISKLEELRYVKSVGTEIRIGALTNFATIAASRAVKKFAPMLAEAAEKVGSVQITNKGTIGGNLGNASPSGDSIPPLYALDARLIIASSRRRREIPVSDFMKGYKQLDLDKDELITEIRFKKMLRGEKGLFLKHSLRFGEAISVVSVCLWVRRGRDKGVISDARIALGAVAPTVIRARRSEEILKQGPLDSDRIEAASLAAAEAISPITDVRGSAEYRKEMVVNLVRRGLEDILAKGTRGK